MDGGEGLEACGGACRRAGRGGRVPRGQKRLDRAWGQRAAGRRVPRVEEGLGAEPASTMAMRWMGGGGVAGRVCG